MPLGMFDSAALITAELAGGTAVACGLGLNGVNAEPTVTA